MSDDTINPATGFSNNHLKLSPEDGHTIGQIAVRAIDMARKARAPDMPYGVEINGNYLIGDLAALHLTHCPLNLMQLLLTSDEQFAHDVFGIVRFWDRRNLVLRDGFKPFNAAAKN